MLESIRRGQRWLTLLLIAFVGGVFVFFMGVGGGLQPGSPTGNNVVELGDIRLDIQDFFRVRAQQEQAYRDQVGDQYDAKTSAPFIDSQALRLMVESAVLADSATAMGLSVSRDEIQRLVRSSAIFRDEAGQFDHDRFVGYTDYEFGGQRNFMRFMTRDLLRQKMLRLLYGHATVSEAEARDAVLYQLEQVRLAWVALDGSTLAEEDKPDEEAVLAYLDEHRDVLMAAYDQRISEYEQPERVHASHILVRVSSVASEEEIEAARAKAQTIRERAVGGEDFAEVARETSDDSGTAEAGGDLGFFAHADNEPALSDAAFALEPGDVSDPVRTDVGFHVIRLNAREPAAMTSFDEVGPDLARAQLESELGPERTRQAAEALAADIEAGQTLQQAALASGRTLERTSALHRRPDGFVPGLGPAPELLNAAFRLTEESPSTSRVFEVGNRFVLIELVEHTMPGEAEFEDALIGAEETILEAKRMRMIQDWIDERRSELERSGTLRVSSERVLAGS